MAGKFIFPLKEGAGLGPPRTLQKLPQIPYLGAMLKAFDFCIPTRSTSVPTGPDWFHEVKYDGYRLRLQRDGDSHSVEINADPWPDEMRLSDIEGRFVCSACAVGAVRTSGLIGRA
jgi:hypothetical protein